MNKAGNLLEALDDLTWENYIDIADGVTLFDKHNIDEELARQSSVYSYYQGLLSVAKKHLDDANLELTKYCAQTRKEKKRSTPVKQTAKDLDDFVESSDDFVFYSKAVNDAYFKLSLIHISEPTRPY